MFYKIPNYPINGLKYNNISLYTHTVISESEIILFVKVKQEPQWAYIDYDVLLKAHLLKSIMAALYSAPVPGAGCVGLFLRSLNLPVPFLQ